MPRDPDKIMFTRDELMFMDHCVRRQAKADKKQVSDLIRKFGNAAEIDNPLARLTLAAVTRPKLKKMLAEEK